MPSVHLLLPVRDPPELLHKELVKCQVYYKIFFGWEWVGVTEKRECCRVSFKTGVNGYELTLSCSCVSPSSSQLGTN